MDQQLTPYFSKLKAYTQKKRTQFDVPGHKLGKINNELTEAIGIAPFEYDVNGVDGLDNLNLPKGVIEDSQALFAEAFHAERAFFLTGGTTLGILALIMTSAKAKEKIIMPRNVHKSIISALIMSGAIPVFVEPHIDPELGIANHMPLDLLKKTINEHPDAKAVLVINPTYFGVASDIKSIVDYAHAHDMVVLADEAHGSHMAFSSELPMTAMQAGADMSATSIHKTSGSLTQSSAILTQGPRVNYRRLIATIHLVQSTSPSALLLASLDVSRKHMYFNAENCFNELLPLIRNTVDKINTIDGIRAIKPKTFEAFGAHKYDETKLIIQVSGLGLTGFDAYKILSRHYDIQVELAESNIILCVFTIATTNEDLNILYDGLVNLAKNHKLPQKDIQTYRPKGTFPEAFVRPRSAYHAPSTFKTYDQAIGEIAAESVMIYPPGIPILIPGEIISKDIIKNLSFYEKQGSTILNEAPKGQIKVVDKETWPKWMTTDDDL